MENKDKSVGRQISFYRSQNGFKQEVLAEMVGITQSQLSDIENDKTSLSVQLLMKFAVVFNVPASVLLPEDKSNVFTNHYNDNSKGTNIMNQYGNSEEERKVFSQLIEAKDTIIKSKDELIEHLKTELQQLRSSNK